MADDDMRGIELVPAHGSGRIAGQVDLASARLIRDVTAGHGISCTTGDPGRVGNDLADAHATIVAVMRFVTTHLDPHAGCGWASYVTDPRHQALLDRLQKEATDG